MTCPYPRYPARGHSPATNIFSGQPLCQGTGLFPPPSFRRKPESRAIQRAWNRPSTPSPNVGEGGGGEDHPEKSRFRKTRPPDRCLLPTPARYVPSTGSGRCKTILPAPGHARQRPPGTDGPAACGGAAGSSPQAWDHVRSRAVPLHLPLVPAHVRAGAASLLLAPVHVRAGAASLLLAPPGQPGPVSADRSVLRSTDLSPAYLRRRLQAVLCRIAATPRHLDCPPAHRLTHHVHPTIQVPSRPPPATAGTGGPRQHLSRAPPAENLSCTEVRSPVIPAKSGIHPAHPCILKILMQTKIYPCEGCGRGPQSSVSPAAGVALAAAAPAPAGRNTALVPARQGVERPGDYTKHCRPAPVA